MRGLPPDICVIYRTGGGVNDYTRALFVGSIYVCLGKLYTPDQLSCDANALAGLISGAGLLIPRVGDRLMGERHAFGTRA